MKLSKHDALKVVVEHLKNRGKLHVSFDKETSALAKNMDIEALKENFEQGKLNSAEEIALIQIGLDLGVFSLNQLDEQTRNLIGQP